jgi:hypothetical protein
MKGLSKLPTSQKGRRIYHPCLQTHLRTFRLCPNHGFISIFQNAHIVRARIVLMLGYRSRYDPACHFYADPDQDPTFHSDADPDPTFQFDANPCGSGYATLLVQGTVVHTAQCVLNCPFLHSIAFFTLENTLCIIWTCSESYICGNTDLWGRSRAPSDHSAACSPNPGHSSLLHTQGIAVSSPHDWFSTSILFRKSSSKVFCA